MSARIENEVVPEESATVCYFISGDKVFLARKKKSFDEGYMLELGFL